MIEERTPAIVLRTRAYAESDKIVTFLSRDWGKLTGIAKGAKRSRRRFVNVLEPFTHVQLRFRPSRSEDLMFILGCELIQAFRRPSADLERFALASYVVELADVMVAGREAGQEMYDLVLTGLSTLEDETNLSPIFSSLFALHILGHAGYAPDLTTCQQCGTILAEEFAEESAEDAPVLSFSSHLGGLLCQNCHGQGGTILQLSPQTVSILRRYQDIPTQIQTPLSVDMPARARNEMRALVTRLLSRHLSRPLKSVAFLEQAGIQTQSAEIDAQIDAPGGE
jgi:DNA repair protein RecO (recombination protein O)